MSKEQYLINNSDGRWDQTVMESPWHFDYDSDQPDYQEVCTFRGEWAGLIEKYMPLVEVNTVTKKNGGGATCDYLGRKAQFCFAEEPALKDMVDTNFDPETEMFSRAACGQEATFTAMAEYLGLSDYDIWFQNSNPGQMCHLHIDKMGLKGREHRHTNPDKLWRFIVMLEDWKIGQVFNVGNSFWKWKAGQCISWPWYSVPHGTANFSWWRRPMLQITGTASDRTHEIYRTGSYENIVIV